MGMYTYTGFAGAKAWLDERKAQVRLATPKPDKDQPDHENEDRERRREEEMEMRTKELTEKAKKRDALLDILGVVFKKDKPQELHEGSLSPYQRDKLDTLVDSGVLKADKAATEACKSRAATKRLKRSELVERLGLGA